MDQPELALEELEIVREYAPKEASVHFLIGKVGFNMFSRRTIKLHFYNLN